MSGQVQGSPRTGKARTGLLCTERNGQSWARRIGTGQSQGRAGPDHDSSKQKSSQRLSRSTADQTHDKEEARQSNRGQDRKCQAREGHDRIMPKKDVAEIVKVGQVCMIVTQGMPYKVISSRCCQNIVTTR